MPISIILAVVGGCILLVSTITVIAGTIIFRRFMSSMLALVLVTVNNHGFYIIIGREGSISLSFTTNSDSSSSSSGVNVVSSAGTFETT